MRPVWGARFRADHALSGNNPRERWMAQLDIAPAAPPGDCSRYVGFPSLGVFSKTPPSIVRVGDCCVGAHQRESWTSKLSHDQTLSTISRSSLLALKNGILFGDRKSV